MSPLNLTFRQADAADAAQLLPLIESAYRGDSSRQGWTTEADLLHGQRTDLDELRALIAASDGGFLLAEHDGQLLGCCNLQRHGERAYLGMFAVRPGLQGQGLGRAVVMEAERRARQWGCRQLEMLVIDLRAELIAWYLRLGYQRTGEHVPFPYDNPAKGLPQRSDLRFERLEKNLSNEVVA